MTDELKNLEEKAQEYDASQIQVLEGLKRYVCAQVCILDQPQKKGCIIGMGDCR